MVKWKAMGTLFISYIPWIVYWTVSAQKKPWGSLIMFVLAWLLVTRGRLNGSISPMDLVAIGYSIVATFSTYIIGTKLFIVGDGYIGYGTLFVFAFVSLLIKKPFLDFYVKKDLDDYDKLTSISQQVTWIWTLVFLISTLIFLWIQTPHIAIISSNIFVAIGILYSCFILSKTAKKALKNSL